MDHIDQEILAQLQKDSRISYAALGRLFDLTRASIKERVDKLRQEGIIEEFTIIMNPGAVGKKVSVFMEIDVEPLFLDKVAKALSTDERVESLYLMTGASTLHMHALLENMKALEEFVLQTVYAQEGILSVRTNTLLKRYKSKRGGPRL
jgi:DNA-binding Lrp family transcriptional regulator